MNILVLGGSGFVGTNVRHILDEVPECDVSSLSLRDGFDLCDLSAAKTHLGDLRPDVIINCAARVGSLNYVTREAATVVDENLRMVTNLYRGVHEASPKTKIINPIANCAYPGNLEIYREPVFWDGRPHQSVISYGITRRAMVVLSECYSMQYGIQSVNLLVPNMYGPFDSTNPDKAHALDALVCKVVKAQREKKTTFEVWGSGVAVREWLYAGDFGRIIKEVLSRLDDPAVQQPINVGQKSGHSVRDIVSLIVQETGFEGEIAWNTDMPDGAPRKVMDDARFRVVFPDFRFTELRDGIRATVEHYEKRYPFDE